MEHMVGMKPVDNYRLILDVWKGQHIPTAWLRSRVVLIYKKKDPQDPRNYRPIYISTAIYNILTRLLLMRIAKAMTPRLLDIQHGALQGRNTTTLATKLPNHLHTQAGYVALLDVAKTFPSVPRSMLTNIVKEAGVPETIIRMQGEIYQHTPAVLSLHGRVLPIRSTRGMKEGCPLSPTVFLLYYDILLRETMEQCPEACLYVFVDDIAVHALTTEALLRTLDTLQEVAHTMGLSFNKDKTEVYHWAKNHNLEPIIWQHQQLPEHSPILKYLGHVLAQPTQEETAWDMVTTQLYHDIAAYRTLLLNGYKKVAIINAVLIPRWTYRGLFLDGSVGQCSLTIPEGHTRDRTTNEQVPPHHRPVSRRTRPTPTVVVLNHPMDYTWVARVTKQRPYTTPHDNPI